MMALEIYNVKIKGLKLITALNYKIPFLKPFQDTSLAILHAHSFREVVLFLTRHQRHFEGNLIDRLHS
jgi:hypothetical protein